MSPEKHIRRALRLVRHAPAMAIIIFAAAAPACKNNRPEAPAEQTAGVSEPARANHQLPPSVSLKAEKNGLINPRSLLFRSERLDLPALEELREREGLDAVILPGRDELEKMKLLCDWTNSQWAHGQPLPYPPWDANVILEMIRAGKTGGFCAQYAVVFCQACLAMGWQARYLDIVSQGMEQGQGHFTVEVWSNQLDKWIVLDPFFDCRFERDGVPLSALEIHQALLTAKTSSIKMVRGNGTNARTNSKLTADKIIKKFHHLAADMRNDHLSHPYGFWNRRQTYLAWQDKLMREKHPLYLFTTDDPLDFNFPVNQVRVRILEASQKGVLKCVLRTNMPEPDAIEIKIDDGPWIRPRTPYDKKTRGPALGMTLDRLYGSVLTLNWKLEPGDNKIRFRAVNARGAAGPETFLWVFYDGD